MWAWNAPASAQSVTWQILPFFQSDWPGSQGQPATTNGNVITLHGQPVRTLQSFSGPLRISYDVSVDARISTDGALQFLFVPTGLASNLYGPNMKLSFVYQNNPQSDVLRIDNVSSNSIATKLWGEVPFSISAQTVYHNTIDISATGDVTSWIINNVTNSIPSGVTIPFAQYKLELESWQPGGPTWTVSNFAVVPEPNTVTLVTASLAGLLLIQGSKRRGKQR
jgi:hypothetical protein